MPFVGVLLIIIGAASLILPFAGPAIGVELGDAGAWVLTNERVVGHVLPAAAVIIGGIMLLPGVRASRVVGGFIAMLGAIWLTISPAVYGSPLQLPAGEGQIDEPTQIAQLLVYHFGTGLFLAILAALAIGATSGGWIVERRVGRVRFGTVRSRRARDEEPIVVPDEEAAREEERTSS